MDNLWKANVELSMQGGENDEQLIYNVDVYVVAPTQELAQYIVATMYPEYESLQIDDDPVGTCPLILFMNHQKDTPTKLNPLSVMLSLFGYTASRSLQF